MSSDNMGDGNKAKTYTGWRRSVGRFTWLRRRSKLPVPDDRQLNPEPDAGFFSLLTFSWMSPILASGYRRPSEVNDIWLVNRNRHTHNSAAKLKANLQANRKNGARRPLARALVQTFKADVAIGALAALTSGSIQVFVPFVVKYIIAYAGQAYEARSSGTPGPAIGRGVGLVSGITIMQIFGSIGYNHFFYRGMLVGGQARSASIAMIFDKAMTISGRAKAGGEVGDLPSGSEGGSEEEKEFLRQQLAMKPDKTHKGKAPEAWGNGRIVNLMSVDTSRIDQACGWFHMIWTTPLMLVVTIILLSINLSYPASVGIALFFTATPLMAYIVRSMLKRRGKINRETDQRITMTQEVLQAIRFVKYYAWEADFLARLGDIRRREIRGIRYLLGHRNSAIAMGSAIPVFSSMLTFITSSSTHHALEPASTFSSLALFNQSRQPLILFPMVCGLVADASKSLTRIEQFLMAEDSVEMDLESIDDLAVDIQDASFTWEKSTAPKHDERRVKDTSLSTDSEKENSSKERSNTTGTADAEPEMKGVNVDVENTSVPKEDSDVPSSPFTLNSITLQIYPSESIAVIGSVGSGKSSLLSAIAGEMRRTSGRLKAKGKHAFCTQVAWIQNATVRDNIIFGREYMEEQYDGVVKACALDHDLQNLPHGSLTEIGERGINSSGGQKQRVSLARAVYSKADVILLDDPLGAVDTHVGSHIMEHAICGSLKDNCRILVTHQLHVLPRCDRIIIMEKGRAVACDTFKNLMANNATFQQTMANVVTEDRQVVVHEESEETSVQPKSDQKAQGALMLAEDHQKNGISKDVYLDYWKSTGSLFIPPLVLLTSVVAQAGNIMTNLWLAWWTDDQFGYSTGAYIGVYTALGVSQGLLLLLAALGFTIFGTEASKNMLHRAFQRISRAPISFFDTTPLGRIMNRFSKDVDVMDNNLTESLRSACTTVSTLVSIIILTIAYYYYFAVALVPLCIFYIVCATYYRSSASEIKRHESVFRSAVYSRFNEAIVGTSTIRAYGMQHAFSKKLTDAIDDMDSAYYLTFANQRWLGVRSDAIGVVFLLVTGMLVVTNRFSISPSISGSVLSYLVSITQTLLLAVRQVADAQNNMNSVERVHYYTSSVAEEAPAETIGFLLPTSWPEQGHISFKEVQMRYRESLPLVSHDLSIDVPAGERLGIVGRTGAGKSSIMVALFRMVESASGSIVIDGVDISSVGLKDSRSRLSIIPQDPTLFRGTVRTNLDPFGQHSDLELWSSLRRAHLMDDKGAVTAMEQDGQQSPNSQITSETVVDTDGANFSLGQRQLMGLARALIRDSRIIVCDEATSSIDFERDLKVQQTMAEAFKGKTVLCIAHRLKTIIGYDRVCVLDNGSVAESGTPLELYDRAGKFRAMCEQSQIMREEIDILQQERGN